MQSCQAREIMQRASQARENHANMSSAGKSCNGCQARENQFNGCQARKNYATGRSSAGVKPGKTVNLIVSNKIEHVAQVFNLPTCHSSGS